MYLWNTNAPLPKTTKSKMALTLTQLEELVKMTLTFEILIQSLNTNKYEHEGEKAWTLTNTKQKNGGEKPEHLQIKRMNMKVKSLNTNKYKARIWRWNAWTLTSASLLLPPLCQMFLLQEWKQFHLKWNKNLILGPGILEKIACSY